MKAFFLNRPGPLMALIAVQLLCTAFFLWDVIEDFLNGRMAHMPVLYATTESIAALSLILALVFEVHYLMVLLRRQAHLERQVSVAAGAFSEVLEEHFDNWGLTPAERDVAMFAIKGFSIAETAEFRGSAEGTVKSQLNAVYRKAGVAGRGALIGLLIDELIELPVLEREKA